MNKNLKKNTILLICCLVGVVGWSQQQQVSPYSFYGIGKSFLNKTQQELAMGATGVAFADLASFHFSNPATVSKLKMTSYKFGAYRFQSTVRAAEDSDTGTVFGLSYLAIGFPIGKKMGFAFGLQSNSGVGYNLEEGDISSAQGLYTYEGSGGTNRVFSSLGAQLGHGLSVGLKGSYLFGNIENNITWNVSNLQFDTREKTETSVRGLELQAGLHFEKRIGDKYYINSGLTATKDFGLNVDETQSFYKGFFIGDIESIQGEVITESFTGDIQKPFQYTFGLGYGKASVWYVNAEYSTRSAMQFKGNTLANNTLGVDYNTYNRYGLGGFYVPKFNSLTSYLARVIYQAGIRYEETGMAINGEAINDFGMSFGVGLPMGRGISTLNVVFSFGKLANGTSSLVQEDYFNLRLGLSFSDKWFKKRKIN